MKIYSKIVALCVFHPNVWGTTAFVVQTPKALTLKGRPSAAILPSAVYVGGSFGQEVSPSYSYLNGLKPDFATSTQDVGISEKAGPLTFTTENAVAASVQVVEDVWDEASPVTVQGGSLKTWSFTTPAIERVQVLLKSEGRPVNALVELWQGPDNSPQKMMVYIEDGSVRPFSAVVETPRGQNAIAIRNTGQMEFPLIAGVVADLGDCSEGIGAVTKALSEGSAKKNIQGGAVHTHPFGSKVESVQIMLKTDGRPLNARIELMQGPNNNKQVIEIYTEDGRERPFFAVIDTPGGGNVIRIVNTATMEFPMTASVEPYLIDTSTEEHVGSYFVLD